MAANRIESGGAAPEAAAKGGGGGAETQAAAGAAPVSSGGIKAYLPLIVTLVAMPLLAYGTTTFLLLPKLQKSMAATSSQESSQESSSDSAAAEEKPHEASSPGESSGGEKGAKGKKFTQLKKVIVNVAGTMGTRFLVTEITMVSKHAAFEAKFADSEPELRHVTINALSSKTITDLEKPGAKNLIRAELTALYNSVFGAGVVQEIFFTEFAVQ